MFALARLRPRATGLVRLFHTDPITHQYRLWHLSIQEIDVAAYGKKMALKHLADISANSDGSFVVSPWDAATADNICDQLSLRGELGMSGTSTIGANEEPVVLMIPRSEADADENFKTQELNLQAALKDADENFKTQELNLQAALKEDIGKSATNRSKRRQGRKSIQEVVDAMPWKALPPTAQELYVRLGWSEADWEDDSAVVATEGLSWDALSAEQQEAASNLGFRANTWNTWADLSEDAKVQWETLGWTAENWNNGFEDEVVSEASSWADLSDKEKDAAKQLGYDSDNWNSWDDLQGDGKAAWGVLGWNAENWERGYGAMTEELQWAELNGAQRAAAAQLGYSQDKWDAVRSSASVLRAIQKSPCQVFALTTFVLVL
jgi:ribosome recycling factor